MTVPAGIEDESETNMTSKGQVLIPKLPRDRAGLMPNALVRVGMNDRGEVVVRSAARTETRGPRAARISAALESVGGTFDTGFATTDDYMDLIRPHRREAW